MAVPDFTGFTPGPNTMQQVLDAIRAAGLSSAWEAGADYVGHIGDPWRSSAPEGSAFWSERKKALDHLGWLTGTGSGGDGGTGGTVTSPPGTTIPPNPNPNAFLENSLSALGIGAVAGGPNYKISSPFRHLFGQDQIDQFAVKDPASLYKMGSDGKIQQAKFDWWRPNATVGSFGSIPLPSTSGSSSGSSSSSSGSNSNDDSD